MQVLPLSEGTDQLMCHEQQTRMMLGLWALQQLDWACLPIPLFLSATMSYGRQGAACPRVLEVSHCFESILIAVD